MTITTSFSCSITGPVYLLSAQSISFVRGSRKSRQDNLPLAFIYNDLLLTQVRGMANHQHHDFQIRSGRVEATNSKKKIAIKRARILPNTNSLTTLLVLFGPKILT